MSKKFNYLEDDWFGVVSLYANRSCRNIVCINFEI